MFLLDYSAVATQPITGFVGPCRLQITKTAIIVLKSDGEEIATWLFNCIRQFNAVDCCFSFISGRRGPFGVGEYSFELPQKKVLEIQKKISGHTGAVFAHNYNYNTSALSTSANVRNPVTDDRSSQSESETSSSTALSSNLYPLTNLQKSEIYQNTGIRCAVAPPLPSKDPVKSITLQNDRPNVNYVNAMNGCPKPLPRTMKPPLKKPGSLDGTTKAPSYSTNNSTIVSSLSNTNVSATLPAYSQKSQVITASKPVLNTVGGHSDLDRDPLEYGDMVCSPQGPNNNHRFFSPPPSTNAGYSDVDYDVIRRNREMGKFADPNGAYSDAKDKKSKETYNVPSLSQAAEDTYDVPRLTGGKFEDIPDVYEDDRKQSSPSDLYNVPTSNHQVSPDLYDVPSNRGQIASQTCIVPPPKQYQIYDNPQKVPLQKVNNDHSSQHDVYDTPRPAVRGHETYDVVPSRKVYSSSPQPQMVMMSSNGKKPGYENIGPNGEILGELVADRLRRELLNSLGGNDHHWMPRPLKEVNSKFSRSCEFLNDIGQESTKRFSSGFSYRRLVMPEQEILHTSTLPGSSWRVRKLHRKLSGSLGDLPTMEDNGDDDTYVILNKTEKPNNGRPPLPAPKPTRDIPTHSTHGVEPVMDDTESNDVYIAMNRSPSHSSSTNTETLPLGYIRMSTAKEALAMIVKKSSSSNDIGRKTEISPTKTETRRSSDLVWPSNPDWSQWKPQDEQASRRSSNNSEVFSPPPDDDHPIVASKSSGRPKRSILLKGISSRSVSGQEKRMGKCCYQLILLPTQSCTYI